MEISGQEKRKEERTAFSGEADFSVIGFSLEQKDCQIESSQGCSVIDVKDKSIVVSTQYSLEPGNLIKFMHNDINNTGIVMWALTHENQCTAEILIL